MRNEIYELTKENKALKKQIELMKSKRTNQFIKVYSLNFKQQNIVAKKTGINKRSVMMRKYLGDITDEEDRVIGKLCTTLNGVSLLVEIDGTIIGIDSTAVIEHIIANRVEYITAEIDKQISNGGAKND